MSGALNKKRARKTPPSRSKRKRVRLPATSSDEELPFGVDEHTETELRNAAARNNLTSDMVKTILKKVCHNDHVLALVRIKEEEQNKCDELESAERSIGASSSGANGVRTPQVDYGIADAVVDTDDDDDDGADDNNSDSEAIDSDTLDDEAATGDDQPTSMRSPFKMTRSLARALNKIPLPVLPLPPTLGHQPAPEIASIITADLRSDDEEDDEEYRPGDDDVPSDEEFNITASDLDSQPPTPASMWASLSMSSPPPQPQPLPQPLPSQTSAMQLQLTVDGQFKVPACVGSRLDNNRVDSNRGRDQQFDYIIAQQTRSKVSLATTPIEIIEANFQPPDVDLSECSISSEYIQFMLDTISDKPIAVDEDDADDDEDFQLPNTPFADREEMYNQPIPEQECRDLFADLCKQIDSDSELQTLINELDATTDDLPVAPLPAPPIPPAIAVRSEKTVSPRSVAPSTPTSSNRGSLGWKSHYARRLYKHLATETPSGGYNFASHGGFLDWQLALLQQQQRMHVQLATQNFLQVYGHPGNGAWKFADTFKGFLTDLCDQIDGEGDERDDGDAAGAIVNLRPALDLVRDWEADRSVSNQQNRGFVRYLEHHTGESKRLAAKCSAHFYFFHPLVAAAMLTSRAVFPYAHLLPPAPFRLDRCGKYFHFMATDDFLFALGLERFYAQLRQTQAHRRARVVGSDVTLNAVCKLIESEMFQWRRTHTHAVYKYVVRRRNLKDGVLNPIQYYFQHGKAPIIRHVLHPFDSQCDRLPLIERDRKYLSKEWSAAADKITAERHSSVQLLNRPSPPAPPASLQVACANCTHVSNLDASLLIDIAADQISTLTVQSDAGPIVVTTIVCPVLYANDLPTTLQCAATVVGRPTSLHRRCTQILGDALGRFLNPLRHERRLLARRHPVLHTVFAGLVSLDVYVRLWRSHASMSGCDAGTSTATIATMGSVLDGACPTVSSVTPMPGSVTCSSPEQDASVSGTAASAVPSSSSGKKATAWKTPLAAPYKVLLTADTPDETNERDTLFAQNFLDRIEALYSPNASAANTNGGASATNSGSDRYAEFLRILTAFDARSASAVDLYASCEAFFLPEHPELAELFLAFLLPADAARLGRFIDHSILQSMSHFVGKLTTYFAKQPAQLRKILTAIKDLADEPAASLTVERIRAKIVPMLRGNPLLIEWLHQCFASDSMGASDATGDYETVPAVPRGSSEYYSSTADAPDDLNADAYEEIAAGDLVADPTEHPCHIRFMNGHIFYGSKIVLPVQLSFQTVQYSSVVGSTMASDPELTDDDCTYTCVHEIRRIGDKKLETLFAVPEDVVVEPIAAPSATVDPNGSVADHLEPSEPLNNADKCCNDVLLKAHAVRLNPTLHATSLRKSSDMLELLRRPAAAAAAGSEKSGSPKKRNATAVESAASSSSASPTKKCKLKRPKARKPTPPKASSASAATPSAVPPVRTTTAAATICTATADTIAIKTDVDEEDDDADETADDRAPTDGESELWSRDEDKIVLEQIKCGFASDEELVQTLLFSGQLPNRRADEIRDRFTFLMDIIANL